MPRARFETPRARFEVSWARFEYRSMPVSICLGLSTYDDKGPWVTRSTIRAKTENCMSADLYRLPQNALQGVHARVRDMKSVSMLCILFFSRKFNYKSLTWS